MYNRNCHQKLQGYHIFFHPTGVKQLLCTFVKKITAGQLTQIRRLKYKKEKLILLENTGLKKDLERNKIVLENNK
jgi:hypothetical protein